MLEGARVAVTVPAYNVVGRVAGVVRSLPALVDLVVVVDDGSTDGTSEALEGIRRPGLTVLRHPRNRGVGAAIATGSREALRLGADVVAVMAGDGQMDPADLPGVLGPVVRGEADYVKGNRFTHPDLWREMPRARIFGNIILSGFTRVTSGYWHIFDSQCGYTAISGRALRAVDGRYFARYGYPNDLLARLKVAGARVAEVTVRPIYDGQPSGIRPRTVIYPILFVLMRSMGRRLVQQHLKPGVRIPRRLDGAPGASSRPGEILG